MIELYTGALLVTPDGPRKETLVIDTRRGKILPPEDAPRAQKRIDASGLAIYPGLINAHDHLELNHFPRTRWRGQYGNASQWAEDMRPHLDEEPYLSLRNIPLADRCWHGGLKNLLSGVTTVAHHNPLYRPLKARDFPVRVLRRYTWAHSMYLETPEAIQKAYRHARNRPFMIHLAEGTDATANDELQQLDRLGCLSERTVLIHGVGLSGKNIKLAIGKSRGLVWCPSTNYFLLGATAHVQDWFTAKKLALGSDSRVTADGNLLDEMRAAAGTGQLDAKSLFELVTRNAAKMLGLSDCGEIRPGKRADLLAMPAHDNVYQNLMAGEIVWVMRAGQRMTPHQLKHRYKNRILGPL
jgi:cytosine/adenosine deaminase-related metal-dependent hydrolase